MDKRPSIRLTAALLLTTVAGFALGAVTVSCVLAALTMARVGATTAIFAEETEAYYNA